MGVEYDWFVTERNKAIAASKRGKKAHLVNGKNLYRSLCGRVPKIGWVLLSNTHKTSIVYCKTCLERKK